MSKLEILVITSDAWLGVRLGAALHEENAACRVVADAAAAIHSLVEQHPATVVIDGQYAAMDPQRLIRRARACAAAGQAVPAVILLAPRSGEDPWLCADVDAVLDRDLSISVLAQRIRDLPVAV